MPTSLIGRLHLYAHKTLMSLYLTSGPTATLMSSSNQEKLELLSNSAQIEFYSELTPELKLQWKLLNRIQIIAHRRKHPFPRTARKNKISIKTLSHIVSESLIAKYTTNSLPSNLHTQTESTANSIILNLHSNQ